MYQIAKVAEVIKAGTPVKGTIKRKPSRFVIDEVEGEGDGSKQTAFEFLLKEERRKGKAQIPKQSVFTEELPLSTTSSEGSPVKALSNKKWFRVRTLSLTHFTHNRNTNNDQKVRHLPSLVPRLQRHHCRMQATRP